MDRKDSKKLIEELEKKEKVDETTLRQLLDTLGNEYRAIEEEWNREIEKRDEVLEEECPLFDKRMEAQISENEEMRSRLLQFLERCDALRSPTLEALDRFVMASRSLDHRLRGAMILLTPTVAQKLKRQITRLADNPKIQQLLKDKT